ncbi:uncharacterized protein UDID_19563 [Ustilago sp. UG-2017a]|nr:uncharacterized protein UDID_19563 [Ustilago sp. UG-2017a]
MVAKFCIYHQKESFVNPEQKQYLSLACCNWQCIKTIYRCLTHKWIDYNITLEVSALITEESIHKAKPKPVTCYRDLVTFITDVVFGNHLLLRCPHKQLQLAAHHLIVSYCAARPGEVALTVLTTDALKYCDLEFYLTLWGNNDKDEQDDDDDNELMEDDDGMLVVRGSGHEVQPSQCRRTRYRLGCEVTFRNLKHGQTNPNMYQTQPLYDSGSPACMEPTIILAQLAKEDGVFDHGISIVSVMETADPEYFKNVDKFLPIPIKAEAKDHFVLHAIELPSMSGRGTTSVAMAQHQSATSTSTLLAADNNGPTSGSNWVVLESAPWTTKMSEAATKKIALAAGMPEYTIYLSRRNIVDIQGLVQRGKESKNHIMLHGLCRVKAITDTPNSLHAYNQAKVALSSASAQGLPAHEYQALKHTYKEKEDLNVCALRGSLFGGAGPAAAARELSQQLQAGGDTNDNDSSDQAGSSKMHQASTSCVPLGSHLDSHTSNQGNCHDSSPLPLLSISPSSSLPTVGPVRDSNADPSYEWMHQAASIPFLSQAPLSFVSTSTPLSSTADDLAHTSSLASGTSLSAEEPLSLHLREKLDGLCNQIGSMVGDLPQPEYDLLKKDGAGVPLCELFAAMTTNNVGTQNAVLATLEKQNGKSCCWCHQPFRSFLSAPSKDSLKPVTRGMMINHIRSCVKPHMYSKYKEACCEALACQPCWHEACCGQILLQDHKELIHHILHHYRRICVSSTISQVCQTGAIGVPLQSTVELSSASGPCIGKKHLETAHGFPTITSNMTKYCAWHDKWTFGHEQTNGHFEMHINALLRGYAEQEWCRQTCWFCLVDKGLPAATRAHCFKHPCNLLTHVCRVHIYPDHSPILTYDFTDHLREHDLVLGAKSLLHRPDLVGKASRACEHRDDWISWVQSITPSPPPPAAILSMQSVAQEEINALMAQAVADAEEQVAGQVGCSVLPISSTGATQEASSANLSCPVLSTSLSWA